MDSANHFAIYWQPPSRHDVTLCPLCLLVFFDLCFRSATSALPDKMVNLDNNLLQLALQAVALESRPATTPYDFLNPSLANAAKLYVLSSKTSQAILSTQWSAIDEDDAPDLLYLFLGALNARAKSAAARWLLTYMLRSSMLLSGVTFGTWFAALLCQAPFAPANDNSIAASSSGQSDLSSLDDNIQEIPAEDASAVTLVTSRSSDEFDAAEEEEVEDSLVVHPSNVPQVQNVARPSFLPGRLFKKAHRAVSVVANRTCYQLWVWNQAFLEGDILYTEGVQSALGFGQAGTIVPRNFRRYPAPSPPRRRRSLVTASNALTPAGGYTIHRSHTHSVNAGSRKTRIYTSSRT
ncbi:hypothetical protein R3P38DRAFT_3348307 [Favolaschia claudopus]|uniref:Uncharacterized protein n=1 Tax=Favolaschia claudopus TaxID=2862362 RepID=A0AAW0CQE7_9AGAR